MNEFKYAPGDSKFNPKLFCEAAIQLVEHDEVERALALLENVPAYYREHTPKEISELKNLIRSKILMVYDMQTNKYDLPKEYHEEKLIQMLEGTMRGLILKDVVQKYNENKVTPHIVDVGPGPYAYPMALKSLGASFSYESFNINREAESQAKEILGPIYREQTIDQPVIFMACEIIEHLFHENDLRYALDKVSLKKRPDHIILSTPTYTYSPGLNDWKTDGLSHLRAYTPLEFVSKMIAMFPEYNLSMSSEAIINIYGVLK